MSSNPYAPPSSVEDFRSPTIYQNDDLARRFTRLVAAWVDGFLLTVVTIPLMIFGGLYLGMHNQSEGGFEQVAIFLLGMGAMLALNCYLLVTRGQSIGKMLMRIQIVDASSGELLPFIRVFVFRHLWMLPLVIVTAIVPGTGDDALINLITLLDVLFIFGASRRCLHDYFAGSKVVDYQPDRQLVT